MRVALGVSYLGQHYQGWQSQRSGLTIQDRLEAALCQFADRPVRTLCAGRTDTGVHALTQVVHFDVDLDRAPFSWVRGTNRFLPPDIAVQWAQPVPDAFHCRASAQSRRYRYLLSQSPVRPSLEAGRVGWSMRSLDPEAMRAAAALLVGRHDFTSFRASACQARSPVKHLRRIDIRRTDASAAMNADGSGVMWQFEFEADAFLHHMIRNIMGCLVRVGSAEAPPAWMGDLLAARSRTLAAPTFSAAGLYFVGPQYAALWQLPASVTQAQAAGYDASA
ncbi:MAG: tRNA pseudouridine(38-40) synthase TruA [Variovorax sp.]